MRLDLRLESGQVEDLLRDGKRKFILLLLKLVPASSRIVFQLLEQPDVSLDGSDQSRQVEVDVPVGGRHLGLLSVETSTPAIASLASHCQLSI